MQSQTQTRKPTIQMQTPRKQTQLKTRTLIKPAKQNQTKLTQNKQNKSKQFKSKLINKQPLSTSTEPNKLKYNLTQRNSHYQTRPN